ASLAGLLASQHDILSEADAKAFLDAYGIPVTLPLAGRNEDEVVALAGQIGYPVVIKAVSPQISHKTEVGAVELNLANEAQLRAAYARMLHNVRQKAPHAQLEAVTVQPMVT